MPHITVQLGPCCTLPFSSGVPSDPFGAWEAPNRIIPAGTNEAAYLRERALQRQRRKDHRSRVRRAPSRH